MGDERFASLTEVIVGIFGSGVALTLGASFTSDLMRPRTRIYYQQHLQNRYTFRALRSMLDEEAWSWPMYARPVLYEQIDHKAHYYFSRAEQAWQQCQELDEAINIPLLKATNLLEKISPLHIFKRLIQQFILRIRINEFIDYLNAVATELDSIRQLHEEERMEEQIVMQGVSRLGERISETASTVGNLNSVKEFKEYRDEIDATLKIVRDAYEYSLSQIDTSNPDENIVNIPDGSNFATASVHSRLGNQVLEYVDLYIQWARISDAFYLDIFKAKMDNTKKIILITLDEKAAADWYSLYHIQMLLDHIDRKLKSSRIALTDFHNKEKVFQGLAELLRKIQLQLLIDDSEKVEADCDSYWRSRNEDPRYWNKALYTRPLPSEQLEKAKIHYQSRISSTLEGDRIKQSKLEEVNTNLLGFIQMVEQSNRDVLELQKELKYHRECQEQFRIIASENNGPVKLALKEIAQIEKDTSEDIKTRCLNHWQKYETFLARANAVRGADFPNLLEEVSVFIAACLETKNSHDNMIQRMRSDASTLFTTLSSVQTSLRTYHQDRPRVEWDWKGSMARLTNILQTYNQSSLSFAYLNSYIQKANSVNSIAQEELIQIQALREEFIKSYKKTQSELQYMVSEINKYYQSKVLAWEWAKAEFSSDMLPIKAIYDEMRTRFVQAQHRFETTPQVIREYENIEEQIQPVLIKLNEIVGRIQERQKDFSKRYNYFLRVITRESANPTENSALFVERLAKFCEIARSHSDPDEVDIVLAAARNLVIDYRNGNFNQRYIAQIDTFIQNYGTIIGSIEAPHGNVAIGDHASQSIRR